MLKVTHPHSATSHTHSLIPLAVIVTAETNRQSNKNRMKKVNDNEQQNNFNGYSFYHYLVA